MLRARMPKDGRVVTLPDYRFTPDHISLLERLSLFCPEHPVRIREATGETRFVPISRLDCVPQQVLRLNTVVLP